MARRPPPHPRRSVPGDRRVKTVVLTPSGLKMKAELLEALYDPPRELMELALADLEALRRGLEKLPKGLGGQSTTG